MKSGLIYFGFSFVLAFAVRPIDAVAAEDRWRGEDAPYLKAIHERLHPRWELFLSGLDKLPDTAYRDPALAVEIIAQVEADGRVARVDRFLSTGVKGFDDAPVDLFTDLRRLPPPSPALYSDDGRTYLRWRLSRKTPGCEDFAVIERRLPLEEALPRLVEAGRIEEGAKRVAEVRAAEPARAKTAMLQLTELLSKVAIADREPTVRAAAAGLIAWIDGGEAQLLKLVADPEPAVRRSALRALGEQPRSRAAIDVLVAALNGEDWRIAAEVLVRFGEKRAIDRLRVLLEDGTAPEIAARMIAQLGDLATVEGSIGVLMAGGEPQRINALKAILALGERASPDRKTTALVIVRNKQASPALRAAALRALAAIGPRGSAPIRYRLLDALNDPNPGVRSAAAVAVIDLGSADLAGYELSKAARDRSPIVRAALAEALAAHPSPSLAVVLIRLAKDPRPEVRAALNAGRRRGIVAPAMGRDEAEERLLGRGSLVDRLRGAAAWRASLASTK